MAEWNKVKWTEAAQIADRLGWDEDLGDRGTATPRVFFEALRAEDRLQDAAFFLAQALPRYETVAWAARTVRDLRQGAASSEDADALKASLLWVQDPSEPRRRAAFEAANRVTRASPERLAAMAVFFSGGAIVPENCPPVPAPPEAAGRMAAGAILLAAIGSADQKGALNRALDVGVSLAEGVSQTA